MPGVIQSWQNRADSRGSPGRMIRRRTKAAGIETKIGNHTFRATGITAYLKNGNKLEIAQQIAGARIVKHNRPLRPS
jgi:integrase